MNVFFKLQHFFFSLDFHATFFIYMIPWCHAFNSYCGAATSYSHLLPRVKTTCYRLRGFSLSVIALCHWLNITHSKDTWKACMPCMRLPRTRVFHVMSHILCPMIDASRRSQISISSIWRLFSLFYYEEKDNYFIFCEKNNFIHC